MQDLSFFIQIISDKMEPFKTFAFDVRTKEGVKLDVKPPHDEKDWDFIKIGDVKIERKANEPYTIRIISESEMECHRAENNGIICRKPDKSEEKKSLFEGF